MRKLPPKVAPQTAPPPTKSNVTMSKSTASPKTPSATLKKACPLKTPSKKPSKTRSLFRRSGPADVSGDITLYHGTTPSSVAVEGGY
ncbi:hypothetical protein D9757_012260 [Collybiopsis confluens]|uniref:Uncharacterized protein n=1 Tax=Collybiopsis confluens TaxID=2823264 RepID=A0A8H5G5R5_9AGAR|nr:hypothetical protein D9757_014871 [Collybiopsis confluens]KAF5358741.1 hypothetical protein D9757_012260 [Collybiopsis confluens]